MNTFTDKELLELAAKAVGHSVRTDLTYDKGIVINDGTIWNPLTDDGDALRLAVKLGIKDVVGIVDAVLWLDECQYAATRRAIVRAAAEIGAGMRPFPTAEEIDQMANMDDRPEWMK